MKRKMFCLVLSLLVFMPCIVLGEVSSGERVHVEQVIDGAFFQFRLNADVANLPKGFEIPLYQSTFVINDDEAWINSFFGTADAAIINEKLAPMFVDKYREHDIRYKSGEIFAAYNVFDGDFLIEYQAVDIYNNWYDIEINTQANGQNTTPHQAQTMAQNWVDALAENLQWNGFDLSVCYAMQHAIIDTKSTYAPSDSTLDVSEEELIGIYVVEFQKTLAGLPIVLDHAPISFGEAQVIGDVIDVYISDQGIIRVAGVCLDYTETGKEMLAVTLDDAIELFKENVDYSPFNTEDGYFDITEIGLCYKLIPALKGNDPDAQNNAMTRPVWRFASGINRNMTNVFVMYVDAVTGEIYYE